MDAATRALLEWVTRSRERSPADKPALLQPFAEIPATHMPTSIADYRHRIAPHAPCCALSRALQRQPTWHGRKRRRAGHVSSALRQGTTHDAAAREAATAVTGGDQYTDAVPPGLPISSISLYPHAHEAHTSPPSRTAQLPLPCFCGRGWDHGWLRTPATPSRSTRSPPPRPASAALLRSRLATHGRRSGAALLGGEGVRVRLPAEAGAQGSGARSECAPVVPLVGPMVHLGCQSHRRRTGPAAARCGTRLGTTGVS